MFKPMVCNFCHPGSLNQNLEMKGPNVMTLLSSTGSWELFSSLPNNHSC